MAASPAAFFGRAPHPQARLGCRKTRSRRFSAAEHSVRVSRRLCPGFPVPSRCPPPIHGKQVDTVRKWGRRRPRTSFPMYAPAHPGVSSGYERKVVIRDRQKERPIVAQSLAVSPAFRPVCLRCAGFRRRGSASVSGKRSAMVEIRWVGAVPSRRAGARRFFAPRRGDFLETLLGRRPDGDAGRLTTVTANPSHPKRAPVGGGWRARLSCSSQEQARGELGGFAVSSRKMTAADASPQRRVISSRRACGDPGGGKGSVFDSRARSSSANSGNGRRPSWRQRSTSSAACWPRSRWMPGSRPK